MRKFFYLFLLILTCNFQVNECMATTLQSGKSVNIEEIKQQYDYTDLINAIIQVESKGDEKAKSPNGQCCGILQITSILVKEVNNIVGYKRYSLDDRFSKEKSIEMFYILQNRHNPSHNIRKAISLWNGGEWYYKKVMTYYNNKTKTN